MRLFNADEVKQLAELGFYVNNGEAYVYEKAVTVYCSDWFIDQERKRGVFRAGFDKPFLASFGVSMNAALIRSNVKAIFDDPITAAVWLLTEYSNRSPQT